MESINKTLASINEVLELLRSGKRYLTPKEAAELSGWSLHGIYNAVHQGRLEKVKENGRVFVGLESLANSMFNN